MKIALIDIQHKKGKSYLPFLSLSYLVYSHYLKLSGNHTVQLFRYWKGQHDKTEFENQLESYRPDLLIFDTGCYYSSYIDDMLDLAETWVNQRKATFFSAAPFPVYLTPI